MIRVREIQDKLLHLVGWKKAYNSASGLRISDGLAESESGTYFQQAHPLLTLENLACIAPDFNGMEFDDYADGEYKRGDIVTYNGSIYKLVRDSNLSDDGSYVTPDDSSYWMETTPFSEWLENKTADSVLKAVSRFCSEKTVEGTMVSLCEKKTLFDGTGRIYETTPNRKNFVGFEIVPIRSRGVTTKINRIGLQFTKPGSYTLYVFHSSMDEPYRTVTLTRQKENSFEWFTIADLFLPYETEETEPGGSWYLCYFQSDIPDGSLAIRKNRDWSKGPCW